MTYNILGISGSPVKEGNVENFLQKMIESVADENFYSEIINLSETEIKECLHCNFCLSKQKPGRYCSINDEAQAIFEKAEQADIIILASPVYLMRTSAKMAALIDRLRVFIFGNLVKGGLRNKIGVSAAVSWLRHGGVETTHLSHIYAFMTLEMIPVSVHKGISTLGASAVASKNGAGVFDPSVRLGIEEDAPGLDSANQIMKRAVELVKLIKKNEE
ncbi:flavodoxin family protein [Desulfonema magnum]|uniref:NADPH-dependent FMN reductase n=1 Tax=Desulfonema magnum TaxID=45655 RepID=A0A975BTZ0_9BACT|nr:flavodoxin family protein [Desulfonema magnum]QTA91267.1 NADPH-dependent FMN reductase [Desulfonema magnum]